MATVADAKRELELRRAAREELARRADLQQRTAQARQQTAREEGAGGAFMASMGRGLNTMGRAVRRTYTPADKIMAEITEEAGLFAPLESEHPISTAVGEAVGEALPLLPAATLAAPVGMAARVTAGGALGATEAGAIAAGKGQDVLPSAGVGGAAGGTIELMLPHVARLGAALFRKLKGKLPGHSIIDDRGVPSKEFQELLDEAGLTIDDLAAQAQKIASGEVEPGAAVRATLFDDLGIATTQSRISQSQADFLAERQLARSDDASAAILHARLAEESQGFADVAGQLVDDLGLPNEAGDSIKAALQSRITRLDDKVNDAYKKIGRLSNGAGIPLAGNRLLAQLDDDGVQAAIGRLKPTEVQSINDLFIEFGMDTDPERIAEFVNRRVELGGGFLTAKTEITPLNVLNFNDLRKGLNALIEPGNDSLNSVAGSLKRGLDDEIDQLSKALEGGSLDGIGNVGKVSLDVIKAARRATRLAKEVFKVKDPMEVVGMLTKKRKGSFDAEHILASEVADKLKGRGRMGSIEGVEMLERNLRRAGPAGETALYNLQSAVVLDLLNAATRRHSAKLAGAGGERVIEWSGVSFKKEIEKLGRDKLAVIFRNNPQAMSIVQKLEAAGDLTVPFATVSKSSGTADDLANFMNKNPTFRRIFGAIGGVKGLIVGEGADIAGKQLSKRATKKKIQQQINASPVIRDQLQFIKYRYPNIALILGVSGMMAEEEE